VEFKSEGLVNRGQEVIFCGAKLPGHRGREVGLSAVKVQQLNGNMRQSGAVYGNPSVEKCRMLSVLSGHGGTLNQWVPGSSPGGCTLENPFRVKGFGVSDPSLPFHSHPSTRPTFAIRLSTALSTISGLCLRFESELSAVR
jgi:hypothetical protein